MEVRPLNAKRIATECKCGERTSFHINIGADGVPNMTGHRSKRDRPPAAYLEMVDIEALRESAAALRDLRLLKQHTSDKIDALNMMRSPIMVREQQRVMSEAMSSTLVQAHGGDPINAITAVLMKMDPDSQKEMMARLMKEFANV